MQEKDLKDIYEIFGVEYHPSDGGRKEKKKETPHPIDTFIEKMAEEVYNLAGVEEELTAPVIKVNDFKFERTPLTLNELNERRLNYHQYRNEPIQFELVNKHKTNKTERNTGLEMVKTGYFHNEPTSHVNANLLVNLYHNPFRSLGDLYKTWRRENRLMDLLVTIDKKEMMFTHFAKGNGIPDSVIDQEREKLEQMKNEIKMQLFQLTKDAFNNSYEYLHHFVQEVILPLYSVEQGYDLFITKPRDRNYYKSVYFNQVINRYHYFFQSNESILVEDEDKQVAILICLKSETNQTPYQTKDYMDMFNFNTYYNYINV